VEKHWNALQMMQEFSLRKWKNRMISSGILTEQAQQTKQLVY